jgi:NADPH:quinone reductase-like Zn-dependent oxidoreductase
VVGEEAAVHRSNTDLERVLEEGGADEVLCGSERSVWGRRGKGGRTDVVFAFVGKEGSDESIDLVASSSLRR